MGWGWGVEGVVFDYKVLGPVPDRKITLFDTNSIVE